MTESASSLSSSRRIAVSILSSGWFKAALAIAVIYALIAYNRIDWSIYTELKGNWKWLALAFLLMLPPYLIVSFRFWFVLRNQGIMVPFNIALRWTMIGSFFDLAMPSNSGGDVVKAGYVVRYAGAGKRTQGVMSVAFDRVLGLLGLFILAGVASAIGWNTIQTMNGSRELMIFLAVLCIGSLLFFRIMGSRRLYNNARIREFILRLPMGQRVYAMVGCFNSLRERVSVLFIVLGLSVLNHVFWCSALLCITVAVSQHVDLIRGFTVFPLAIFSNVFGVAGGFGVGTAAFDVIFLRLLDIQVGATIGLTFQILSAISRLTGLPFYLTTRSHKKQH